MAEQRALVLIDGQIQELPIGDTLTGAGAGGNVDAFYASSLTTDLGANPSTSVSAFASKGNRLIALIPGRVTQISYILEAGGVGGAYEAFVAKLSNLTGSATITAIEKIAFVPGAVSGTVTFPTPFNFISGDILFFGLTKTDIAGAADPLVRFWGGNTDNFQSPYFSWSSARGVRIASNSLTVSTAITDTTISWWSMNLTFEPLNALVPQGGTAGQVLSKIDGSDYNVQWTTPVSDWSMTQTEITATSYSTINADFTGNVVRRMNNEMSQTITVEPSMSGGQPVTFIRVGAGAVSFAAGAGVTILSAGGNLSIADRYGSATVVPDATTADTYYLIGNLTT